jgi:hypothetical protein
VITVPGGKIAAAPAARSVLGVTYLPYDLAYTMSEAIAEHKRDTDLKP